MEKQGFEDRYQKVPNIFLKAISKRLSLENATILDFGCDFGVMSLGLAHHCKPMRVIGVDINDNFKSLADIAGQHIQMEKLPDNLEFRQVGTQEALSALFDVDCVFSWSVFEHVNRLFLPKVAKELYDTIKPGGFCYIQIAPLFYSAFGSHLETIITQPWAHLEAQLNLFKHSVYSAEMKPPYDSESERNFNKIKEALWSTYETLNKITADELVVLFKAVGFRILEEMRSMCQQSPSRKLLSIFNEEVLKTEQIVLLMQK